MNLPRRVPPVRLQERLEYPLTPMQEGMLFHRLVAPGSGVDVEQILCRLPEAIDVARLCDAFDWVSAQHAILRTRFEWIGRERPIQIVEASARIPCAELDASGLSADAWEARLADILRTDRATDFDMQRAPLMRLTTIRRGPSEFVVLWSFHHILLDGRSFPIVLGDVFDAYDTLGRGLTPRPMAARPFADFIAFDPGTPREESERYYRTLLEGVTGPTPLEVAFTARTPITLDQRQVSLRLTQDETTRLVNAARRHGVTPNTLFQTAWALVLARYASRDDVVFGTTRACRNPALEGSRDMVGLLINTVPFRVRIPADDTVGELLARVRAEQVEQRAHERMGLSEIQRLAQLPSGSPLFESIAVFDNATLDGMMKERGPRFERCTFEYHGQTNFPLTLAGYLDPELLIRLEFEPTRFDVGTAQRMLRHVAQLLVSLSGAEPTTLVRDVAMLSATERHQLIESWNDTDGAYPDTLRMHEAFEAQAARAPLAVALSCAGETLRYGELDARANQLAHLLVSRGVGRASRVGLCLERSFDLIVSMLAVLKAGGTYVPLDPAYPEDRLRFMLEDTNAALVVAHSHLCARLPAGVCPFFEIDREAHTLAALPTSAPACPSTPEDLAYIIYTSGSTGRPKGVIVRHKPALNLIDWVNTTFEVGPSDRLLFVTSVCFDLSVYDVFGMLAAGGSIHIATAAELKEPRALVALLASGEITFWDSAPAALNQLVPFFPKGEGQSALRLVFLSGDWIPVPLPDRIREAFPRAHVVSLGGATEATIWSNFYEIGDVDLRWPSIPYGKPIRNARYYVLDDRLEPLPVGAPGQLHIGGICLADGYHQRPELNAEKFIANPYLPGTKLYRTGDLARFMPDGNLEFLGRLDLQVKVRGYRIELGEIEAVINQHPGVMTSLLDAPRGTGAERMLVAYVVPQGTPPDLGELRAICQQKLPDYMVPAHFMVLDALPMTPNGKVDRKALPAPTSQASAAYVAPRTPVEEALCAVFATCLGRERVGVHDSFFELGGHSLLAVRAISEIGTRLSAEVPLARFLSSPNVAAVAKLVEELRAQGDMSSAAPVRLVARPQAQLALSLAQERLVFIQRLDPQSAAYNISLGFELDGEVDAGCLQRTLELIVQRHEPLRTAFDDVGGVQQARIAEGPFAFAEEDLRGVAESDRDLALSQLLRAQSSKPFELARAPLFRALLVRTGERRAVLSIVVHHVVFDGASTGVLLEELTSLYDALKGGRPNPLPSLRLRFNDYAVQQRESVRSDAWERDVAYWRERLAHPLPILQLPADHPRPRSITYRGAVLPWSFPRESSQALAQLARRHGATTFNVVLAGFAALLHHYSGQSDLIIGTPISAREHDGLAPLVGLFLNTVVIRLSVAPGDPFARLLEQTRRRCIEALEHRTLPFERLVEEINPPRDTSTTPVFQAFFGYEETTGRLRQSRHFTLSPMVLDQGFSRTDLSLFVEDSRDLGIQGFFEFSTDLFDRDTIAELAQGLTALLEHALEDEDTKVAGLRVMSREERARQLLLCNQTQAPFDFEATTAHRFESEALSRKEQLAVCYGDDELSYGELWREVRLMATRLREAGAGPGRGVALFLERTPRLLIAMLATHRVGSHYIPLDPTHPPERNGRVLRLSAPAVVVTDDESRTWLPDVGTAQLLDLDQAEPTIEDKAPIAARPDGLAYIIFTSGSTGDPKGVEIEHRALTNFLCSMALTPGMGPDDHVVAITTVSFDIAELELLLPVVTGASVEIVGRATALDPRALAARLADRPATVFQATPATYRMLIESGWRGEPRLKALCGGEPLPRDLAEALTLRVGSLWNMYGPTETTVWSSLDQVRANDAIISIGRPIHNTQIYVLNESLEPVPRGATGMLYIAGEGVARGYHGRADLTQAAFVRDPHALRAGARMYRTGDLGRRLRDGRLECLGRNDFQVKIRGYRIELGEIETALASHPAVKQGVVDVDRSAGEPRLVAFVVPGDDFASESVLDHLRKQLPPYMVPGLLVTLDALPLTANGKVDRKALRASGGGAPAARTGHVAPRDDMELRVAAIYEQLLGVANPSVDDGFFDLGGHSLLAVRLTRELNTAFGVDLSIGTVFERPTIAGLTEAIRAGGGTAQAAVLPLNRGKGGVPLYFICGIHLYRQLARALGEQQPSYGIFLPEEQQFFEEHSQESATVEELARLYVASMRRHTPNGPYMLAGVSFGGLLAFEMARQLTHEGDEVPLVVLIDAILPTAVHREASNWLKHQVEELKKGGVRGLLKRAERKLRGRFAEPEREPGDNELDGMRRAAYGAAADIYERTLQTYDGTTVLIRASDNGLPGATVDHDLGWARRCSGSLRIYQSVGDHLGVLREPLTAEIMRRELTSLSMSRPSLFPIAAVRQSDRPPAK